MEILIVDDNESLSRTMSFILQKKGHQITTANNGMKAIEIIENKILDIIFMDIKMPGLNGVDTYKQIKRIQPETVVIMMTAYTATELAVEAIQEGAFALIHKPLNFDQIFSLINRVKDEKESAFILVVDDDENTRVLLRDAFTSKGYRVTVAKSGEDAIAMTRVKPHDVTIIDVKLPLLNGLETFLEIQKINPQAIVIMMTGHREREVDELVKEALDHKAYTCIYKPFDVLELVSMVDEISVKKPVL